ncbi:DMT family transporter [Paracoccus methylarcula]|uniref:EamA/RhaT family transporter n=1 Tax=Paracoccus methylarcula TaxID=72022 RepID=A0A3R7Q457_9RHOB|nr:DMT family transporter [Paracoccus methylarcula]RNF35834.1 EamA/RhaT family transporter [Paracoccus methylarcula]
MKQFFLTGVGLRLLAVFLITAMSAVIHAVGTGIELGQIIFWRSAIAMLPILVYMRLRGDFPQALRTSRPRLHLTRGLLGVATMALSFLSLIHLPVANAQAFGFLAPVLSLPLAALFLKEKLTLPILIGVLLGFSGVILMLFEAFEMPGDSALIGVAAGLGYATLMAVLRVYVKAMTRTERAATIAFYFALSGAVAGLATVVLGWTMPDTGQLAMLCGAGLLGGLAHIASTEAVARAPVSVIAPFDFTGLVWAAGFDLLFFQHLPGRWALIGMIAITAAALLVTFAGPRHPRPPRLVG